MLPFPPHQFILWFPQGGVFRRHHRGDGVPVVHVLQRPVRRRQRGEWACLTRA